MSPRLLLELTDFLEEMQSLVEEDDGTVFQMKHIWALEEISALLEEETNECNTD